MRKYLLRWREKFRRGEYGIGGDLKYVDKDGVAELRVCEVPELPKPKRAVEAGLDGQASEVIPRPRASTSRTPGLTKLIINLPPDSTSYTDAIPAGQTSAALQKPKGLKLKEGHIIVGSYVYPKAGSSGSTATIRVTEGMWEHTRGRKVHGGERRRAQVLFKERAEARKKERR